MSMADVLGVGVLERETPDVGLDHGRSNRT